jgi:hypothetical protein
MTGSVAIDVAIGLVFIFLLYSLLASIIQEIIATILSLRAKNLRHAIRRMLTDEPEETKLNIIGTYIKYIWKRISPGKNKGLLKEFYKQPIIKYLGSWKLFSKPSYLNESDFSSALLAIIRSEGKGQEKKLDQIKEGLKNLRKKYGNYSDDNLQNQSSNIISKDTLDYLESLLDESYGDIDKFKIYIESWFNNTMERAKGWYKRTIQLWLLVLGFTIASIFNVNTIEITKILSTDKVIRDNMVKLGVEALENQIIIKAVEAERKKTDKKKSIKNDSIATNIENKLDSINNLYNDLKIQAEKANSIMGIFPPDSLNIVLKDSILKKQKKLKSNQKIIQNKYVITFPNVYLANRFDGYYKTKKGCTGILNHAEFKYWEYWWDNKWGYLITAIAISLGAPFWFDLLNKLVKLRNSTQSQSSEKNKNNAVEKKGLPADQRDG